jgi:hypothetical protein
MACSNSHTKLVSSTHAFLYAPGCNHAQSFSIISDLCVKTALKIGFQVHFGTWPSVFTLILRSS